MNFINDLLVLVVDHWVVNLGDYLMVDYGLDLLMNDSLMMLVDEIVVVLMNDWLMMFMNHLSVWYSELWVSVDTTHCRLP